MVGKIWSLPVLGPHLLPPSPWSHCPNTLASCCPGNHQACRYLRAFALVPSAQNALFRLLPCIILLTCHLLRESFSLKQLPAFLSHFALFECLQRFCLFICFCISYPAAPATMGAPWRQGPCFVSPHVLNSHVLSLAPSGSLLSGVNEDKPLWSPALEGPVCRRMTRKHSGQSLGEGRGTGTT